MRSAERDRQTDKPHRPGIGKHADENTPIGRAGSCFVYRCNAAGNGAVVNYEQLRQAAVALSTLNDIGRSIFNNAPFGNRSMEIAFPFGGQNKRDLTEEQAAVVLRALYDNAASTLSGLGITP